MSIRSIVFIDKLSITAPLPRPTWEQVTENFIHVEFRGKNLMPLVSDKAYQHYRFAWKFALPGRMGKTTFCLLQAWPKSDINSFLRIEWNPSKAAPGAFREIVRLIVRCIPAFRIVPTQIRITRADFTFNVYRLNIGSVCGFTDSARTTTQLYKQNNGNINGFYLGAATSNKRLLVYDKVYEQHKGKPLIKIRNGELIHHIPIACTRFEFRFRDLGLLSELSSLRNGLSLYSIYLFYKAQSCCASIEWQKFIDNCRSYSTQETLKLMSDRKRRKQYRDILKERCAPDWYDRQQIWDEGIAGIRTTLLPRSH